VSEFEKGMIIKHFNISSDKIVVIPNGINTELIQVSKPYNHNKKIILYVGRLERYKNIDFVIKSLKYLSEIFSFFIIGSGPYKTHLMKTAKDQGVSNRVQFLGKVSDKDLYNWLHTASLVINLSHIEAFGIIVLEALAAGKPVIVNNKFALEEMAKNFNEVVAVNLDEITFKELAHLIERLSDIDYPRLQLNQYDWDNISQKYNKLYLNIFNSYFV